MRRRPDGTPRRPRTWSSAAPTSDIAGPTRRQQQLAGFGERDAAGGAVHQAHAEPLLHVAQPLAEARHRDALLGRGAAEIPGARHGDEGVEIAEIEILHCSI